MKYNQQIRAKRALKEAQLNTQIKELWERKNNKLIELEKKEKQDFRNTLKQIENFNKKMAQEKEKNIEREILDELNQDKIVKAKIKKEQTDLFKYAERCIKERRVEGQDIKCLLLEMRQYKDFLMEGNLS